ncbi:MAG: hypothetical protein AAF658_04845 [Myxococcota bacterium]
MSVLIWTGACSSSGVDNTCSSDIECPTGNSCVNALCVPTDLSCSATNPCPSGQSCCGGTCTTTSCCSFDQDCANGWCSDGICIDGARPQCSANMPCDSGNCLEIVGRCVECTGSNDCLDGRVCTLANQCELPGNCSVDNTCSSQGLVCDAQTGNCRPCVSRIECGDLACSNGSCQACTGPADCGTNRSCVLGRCVNAPGAACTTDANCTDGLICAPNNTCDACQLSSECPGSASCIGGRCNAINAACAADGNCNPPNTICSAGSCVVGCSTSGCPGQELCNPLTGRCQATGSGSLPLGVDCTTHGSCESGVCYPLDLTGDGASLTTVCSQSCVTTTDCPDSFVCVTLGDGNYCLAKSLVGNRPWNLPPGASCTDGFKSDVCKSGFCDPASNRCIETCATDADCTDVDDSFVCVHRNIVGTDANDDLFLDRDEIEGFTSLCQPPLFLGDENLSVCTEGLHDGCARGFCVQTPDQIFNPICAQGCCTPNDCTAQRPICKPIDMWDGLAVSGDGDPRGYQRTCLWTEYAGTKAIGESCMSDDECASEICAMGANGGRCSHTCCRASDCSSYAWSVGCRTPIGLSVVSGLNDPNFGELVRSLGRQFINGEPLPPVQDPRAAAATTMCVPE